ncbi:3D domain-containing protein [Paenibacillus thalictri]|uniref:3D domain-containing protein n=1 Tax=Paenibacillus thalictri TaxID=2527873 RepID=A0A4Q9DEK7_9BACL|nr:3D domain-containing protein [Paenibacillus thalictri]TBL70049.1 hypothetical protein EYB31_34110 [Paenibacillus thalictri]
MLPKKATQVKWICLMVMVTIMFVYMDQERQPVTEPAASPALSMPTVSAAVSTGNAAEPAEAIAAAAQSADMPSKEKTVSKASTYVHEPSLKHDLSQYVSIEVVATGYYAGKESTGKTPGHPEYGVTYSGIKVRRDNKAISTIAADPNVFPLGTVLYIPGYGYGIVADTGSMVKGNRIDLYFETKDQIYKEWGKKTVNVFVVKKGEGKVNEAMLNVLEREILS